MRKIFRFLLYKPIMWLATRFASRPRRDKIFTALDKLYKSIQEEPGKRGLIIPLIEGSKFIIFSDQHKGRRNGADDFKPAAPNYLKALDYYYEKGFHFINLGDSEELWENNLWQVKKHNKETFEAEKKFLQQQRFTKVFGNHDLFWDNDPLAWWQLKSIYGEKLKVYEGVVLKKVNALSSDSELSVLLTHGHQGDASSDGNWFSKFFVAKIWAPLQAYLQINPNTPACDAERKTLHNNIMYEWSSQQQNLLLITGHTHQPVFASLTHLERLYKGFQEAADAKDETKLKGIRAEIQKREKEFTAVSVNYMDMRPNYFNSGCCCFSDGDITGIEINNGFICLIKWSALHGREELEKASLASLF